MIRRKPVTNSSLVGSHISDVKGPWIIDPRALSRFGRFCLTVVVPGCIVLVSDVLLVIHKVGECNSGSDLGTAQGEQTGLGLKKKCCEKYTKKGKACGKCPVIACLSKKKRKKLMLKMAA